MTLRALAAVVLASFATAACSCREAGRPSRPVRSQPTVITHVTLIDPSRGPQRDVTIVMEGGRIQAVGPSQSVDVPAGASVLDATGRFAVPGFWDAHVHLSQVGADAFPLFIANGVTGVRDMGSDLDEIARWKRERGAGGLLPRIFSPGPKLDGAGELLPDTWIVASPAEARAAVERLKDRDVDFIKVHNGLSRPVYGAIVEACRERGLKFAGHATGEISPLLAAASGQRTIEHGRGMLTCSPELWRRIRADRDSERMASICAPETNAAEIMPALARAGVWFTPTLASWRAQLLLGDAAAIARLQGLAFVTPSIERRWREAMDPPLSPLKRDLVSQFGSVAAKAHRAGVHLLAGTDVGDPYVMPGFGLHDELALLVEAGVPPLEAIRSATLEPALALGIAADVGSIERGKAADLVLLAADPLVAIENTRRIVAVVINGRLLDDTHLRALVEPMRAHR